jgi:hypothetical protein
MKSRSLPETFVENSRLTNGAAGGSLHKENAPPSGEGGAMHDLWFD